MEYFLFLQEEFSVVMNGPGKTFLPLPEAGPNTQVKEHTQPGLFFRPGKVGMHLFQPVQTSRNGYSGEFFAFPRNRSAPSTL